MIRCLSRDNLSMIRFISTCFLLLLFAVGPCYSLSCYVCKSTTEGHDKCGEDTVDTGSVAVYHNCTECQLSVHAINDVVLVQRQCVVQCVPKEVEEEKDAVAARLSVQCCDTDLCNSAQRIRHDVIIALLNILVAVVFWQ